MVRLWLLQKSNLYLWIYPLTSQQWSGVECCDELLLQRMCSFCIYGSNIVHWVCFSWISHQKNKQTKKPLHDSYEFSCVYTVLPVVITRGKNTHHYLEDLSLIPSSHMRQLLTYWDPSSCKSNVFFWSATCMYVTATQIHCLSKNIECWTLISQPFIT